MTEAKVRWGRATIAEGSFSVSWRLEFGGVRLVKSARDKWVQMRGGSWNDNVDLANSADDDLDFPEFRTPDVGLRLRRGGEHG